MIYLQGAPCLMLVLGALLSETNTHHLPAHNCLLDDDEDDFDGFDEANDDHTVRS